jgi:hypothetical protein
MGVGEMLRIPMLLGLTTLFDWIEIPALSHTTISL